ncbi:hypothetical protein Tco_0640533 [Tanacetum coccineum]
MASPVITISSDVSKESVGSVVPRVIPFGTIPTKILIILDIPTDLPTALELPVVSPFLCSDDSESEPANELSERHVSLRPYDDVVSRWRDRVRFRPSSPSGSSSPDTTIPSVEIPVAPTPSTPSIEIATASPACISTPGIIASPAVHSCIRTTTRKSTLGLRPVITPECSATFRRTRRAALSLETSSSDTSSGSSSDSTSHTSESSFTASLQGWTHGMYYELYSALQEARACKQPPRNFIHRERSSHEFCNGVLHKKSTFSLCIKTGRPKPSLKRLAADNGSSPLVYSILGNQCTSFFQFAQISLSSREGGPIDKVPCYSAATGTNSIGNSTCRVWRKHPAIPQENNLVKSLSNYGDVLKSLHLRLVFNLFCSDMCQKDRKSSLMNFCVM